jgi:hypothetical protein
MIFRTSPKSGRALASDLKTETFWYLATPYSKDPRGIESAFQDACRATGALVRMGVPVYSPIAHTHPVAIHSGMDPFNHTIWLPADAPMMNAASGLIVAMMPGWAESYGISEEIGVFRASGKPVLFMEWPE